MIYQTLTVKFEVYSFKYEVSKDTIDINNIIL